jgi:uncharacterized membrane protein
MLASLICDHLALPRAIRNCSDGKASGTVFCRRSFYLLTVSAEPLAGNDIRSLPVTTFVLALVTGLVFLAGDFFMIPVVMRPLFQKHLGAGMVDSLRLMPAFLFYIIHIGGLVYFAGLPATRDGSAFTALVNGALIGLIAYSCYEMTSHTIMRDWHINLVLVDLTWGVIISALSAWLGALAALWWIAR